MMVPAGTCCCQLGESYLKHIVCSWKSNDAIALGTAIFGMLSSLECLIE